jgi:hypothetical protein
MFICLIYTAVVYVRFNKTEISVPENVAGGVVRLSLSRSGTINVNTTVQ